MKDLHAHLSGSTNPIVLWELIKESGYKFKASNYWDFLQQVTVDRRAVKDLDGYLRLVHIIDKVQSSPEAIKISVYDAFRSAFLAGCTELELRFNPVKRSQDGSIDLDALIVFARAGMEKAKMNFGMEGGLILCLGRDVTPEANMAIFNKAVKYFNKGVIGIDIAGPYSVPKREVEDYFAYMQLVHDRHKFEEIYRKANEMGMLTTVHCGEESHWAVKEEIQYTLHYLCPKRIGHGIQITRFPDLIEVAKGYNPHFEVCISSNFATGAVKSEEEFARIFRTFNEAGLEYSINTDSTYLLGTDIRKENALFERIKKNFAFSSDLPLDWHPRPVV
jgi:adenosine deaminase